MCLLAAVFYKNLLILFYTYPQYFYTLLEANTFGCYFRISELPNRIHNTHMKTIENYIVEIDDTAAAIVTYVRGVILSCNRNIEEKTSYGIPFYYFNNQRLCYIQAHNNGVDIAFCDGDVICDPFRLLQTQKRKHAKIVTYTQVKEIDADKIIALLQQALLISEIKPLAILN